MQGNAQTSAWEEDHMLEHHFGHLALQVEQTRHADLLAMAERERQGSPEMDRRARRRWRMLAGFGTWLVAMGQYLEHAGVHRSELGRWL
jgi:hypothetical protein